MEFLALASGWLGTASLGAQSVLANMSGTLFVVPLSVCIATSIRVGNLVGHGAASRAKKTTYIALGMVFVIMVCVGAGVFIFRHAWAAFFTYDPAVYDLVVHLLPLLCIVCISDALQSTASGALRGCGRQALGAVANLGCYYMIAIPLALMLAFKFSMGVQGLWLGQLTGNTTQVSAFGGTGMMMVMMMMRALQLSWQ